MIPQQSSFASSFIFAATASLSNHQKRIVRVEQHYAAGGDPKWSMRRSAQNEAPQNFLTLSITISVGSSNVGWNLDSLDKYGYKQRTIASAAPGAYGYLSEGSTVTEVISLDSEISTWTNSNFGFTFGEQIFFFHSSEMTFTNAAGDSARIFRRVLYDDWASTFSIAYSDGKFFSTPPGLPNPESNENPMPPKSGREFEDNEENSSAAPVLVGAFVASICVIVIVIAFFSRQQQQQEEDGETIRRAGHASRTPPLSVAGNNSKTPAERKEFIKNNLFSMSVRRLSLERKSPNSVQSSSSSSSLQNGNVQETATERCVAACAICLMAYQEGDQVCFSTNANCQHTFHKECMEPWLEGHEQCPCCRQAYLKEDDERTEEA